ncbi:MAG: hypothetical protein GY926_14500 [bacterium]|nr:hypothetical protein [bacterium]
MEPVLNIEPTQRLAELRRTVRLYQERYGELSGMIDVTKANAAMASRQRRLAKLEEEVARIQVDINSMSSEVQRIERWVEFCLEDVIVRAKQDHAEGWSPTPVLGFRLWGVGEEALHGVKMPWPERTLVATCLSRGGGEEIPHTDGRCGRLGCGVYAAKLVDPLYTEFDVTAIGDVALGLVALTGKVVEHDEGYRAASATVIALAASLGKHVVLTSDAGTIDGVFADPAVIRCERKIETHGQRLTEMETFVMAHKRRATPWTLAINKE